MTATERALGRLPNRVLPDFGYIDLPVKLSLTTRYGLRARHPSQYVVNSAARELLKTLDTTEFDLIHAHGMYALPAGAVARSLSGLMGIPYVVSVHGSDINSFMDSRRVEYSNVLDGAGAVAYVSSALRSRAAQFGSLREDAFVIPNGVDADIFRPAEGDQRSNARCIAYIGNLTQVKGADRLPDIFRMIVRARHDAQFIVAGDGDLRPSIEAATRDLPVTYLGFVPTARVAQLLTEASLAILPSRDEGWPCVVLEAYACGTPVVGTDVGGVAEAIGSRRGLVPLGDGLIERIVDEALRLIDDPPSGAFLRSRALEFDWSNIVAQEEAMFEVALQANADGR